MRGVGGVVVVATGVLGVCCGVGTCLGHSVAVPYFTITPATNKGNDPYKPISTGSNVIGNLVPQTNTSYHERTCSGIPIILITLFRREQVP